MEENYDDKVIGRNSVLELLKSGKDINKLYIQKGETHGSIKEIIAKAKERRIVIQEVEKNKLDAMIEKGVNHQGVIAVVPPFDYQTMDDILNYAAKKGEKPFIIMLDGIEDPHNLGSIIRTAECVGVHGIIIPKRRAAQVNATVSKTSVGAVNFVKIARVNNLNDTIRELKEKDIWIYGTYVEDGKEVYEYNKVKYDRGTCIVIGSEGEGISNLVKKNCDFAIKIPMVGNIESLNASVAAGVVMYEVYNQNHK